MFNIRNNEVEISVEPPIRNVVLNRVPDEGPQIIQEAKPASQPHYCPGHIPEMRRIEREQDVIIFGLKMKRYTSGNIRQRRVVKVAINRRNSNQQ
ncbi:hypothetical protein TNIN_163471 [Trichonephila inaurata madagascariensis]|uniref:Uncharacterized protein n=1 Tax=Trichonephila inaurata madagascariensis TaxID=2747483 RepID=A0A8X7BX26_9ARAC|nr:hypothetical protein TNIN_163471 [Trichonephila inaurata madagascariensis]